MNIDVEVSERRTMIVEPRIYTAEMVKGLLEQLLDAKTKNLNFGQAIEEMKAGRKVWRDGWNDKGVWLILAPELDNVKPVEGAPTKINPRIDMMTATGEMQPGWLASPTDMLACDWQSDRK